MATRQEGQPWIVSLIFPFRGRARTARWRFDQRTRSLEPANKLAIDVGWIGGSRSRAQVPSPNGSKPAAKAGKKKRAREKTARKKTSARKPATRKARPAPREPTPARRDREPSRWQPRTRSDRWWTRPLQRVVGPCGRRGQRRVPRLGASPSRAAARDRARGGARSDRPSPVRPVHLATAGAALEPFRPQVVHLLALLELHRGTAAGARRCRAACARGRKRLFVGHVRDGSRLNRVAAGH